MNRLDWCPFCALEYFSFDAKYQQDFLNVILFLWLLIYMHKYKRIYQIYDNSIIWLDNETAIKLDVKILKEFLNSYKSQWWVRMLIGLVLIFPLIFINLYFLKENTSFRSNYNISM